MHGQYFFFCKKIYSCKSQSVIAINNSRAEGGRGGGV